MLAVVVGCVCQSWIKKLLSYLPHNVTGAVSKAILKKGGKKIEEECKVHGML